MKILKPILWETIPEYKIKSSYNFYLPHRDLSYVELYAHTVMIIRLLFIAVYGCTELRVVRINFSSSTKLEHK